MERAVEIRSSVRIAAPRPLVWNVLADVARQPDWMTDAGTIEFLTPGPLGVGTRLRMPVHISVFRASDTIEVTTFDPPHRWTVRHVGSIRGCGEFRLSEEEGGRSTEVAWTERLVAPLGPIGALGLRLLAPLLRRQFGADLCRLRDLCESGAISARPAADRAPRAAPEGPQARPEDADDGSGRGRP